VQAVASVARKTRTERQLTAVLKAEFQRFYREGRTLATTSDGAHFLTAAERLLNRHKSVLDSLIRRAGLLAGQAAYKDTCKELRRLGLKAEDRTLTDEQRSEILREMDKVVKRQLDPVPRTLYRDLALLRSNKDLRPAANIVARRVAKDAVTLGRVIGEKQANQDQGTGWWFWITVGDSHVRPTHRAANKQRRKIGNLFTTKCRFPRDPLGAVEETANCRCHTRPALPPRSR
jgi:hypothetical protein